MAGGGLAAGLMVLLHVVSTGSPAAPATMRLITLLAAVVTLGIAAVRGARDLPCGQTDAEAPPAPRPRVRGKFLYVGEEELLVRGVTYGPFAPGREASDVFEQDLAAMAAAGVNMVRTYNVPSRDFLDAAWRHGLRVMVGLAWEQHVAFLDDPRLARQVQDRLHAQVSGCCGHPAILCYVVGNEIPTSVVRWHGARRVERFLQGLCRIVRNADPGALVTYVNYPSTEYLQLDFLDFLCFNVYLETPATLTGYLARLQSLAGDRPLVMGEMGVDSGRHGETGQAAMLDWQVRAAFAAGCAGVCVFAWTDEWHRGGSDIEDWHFGLTDRQRRPKPALAAVSSAYAEAPFPAASGWPSVSVVVCAYNAAPTLRECCDGLAVLDYPDYEVIVVDDGSTDDTCAIAQQYDFRLISTENRGLSQARNTGLAAARGDIVAYIDSDAYPDPRWLQYLTAPFRDPGCAAAGGPNLVPPDDPATAQCVGRAPGGPTHVLLSDSEAEHIPGCNMAFRKTVLAELGGFDPVFRIAGDDVDICWRLRDHGWKLGFSPSAVVWHHPRGSVHAYWKQQRRYGEAEAMLQRKWPTKYSRFGHPAWEGHVYCESDRHRPSWGQWHVYQGVWGTAPFQSIYPPQQGWLRVLTLMPEWYLVVLALSLLSLTGLAWWPLFLFVPGLALAIAVPVVDAVVSVRDASNGGGNAMAPGWRWRLLAVGLHLLQPLARLVGRVQQGVAPWGWGAMSRLAWPVDTRFALWTDQWQEATAWVGALENGLAARGRTVSRGGDYDPWDLQVPGGVFGCARVRLLVEEHGSGGQLIRIRAWPRPAARAAVLMATFLAFPATLAAVYGAWTASALLGAPALVVAALMAQQSASALDAVRSVLEGLDAHGALRRNDNGTRKAIWRRTRWSSAGSASS